MWADLVDDVMRVPTCTKYCYAVTASFLGCDSRDVGCVCKQSRNLMYYAEPCVTGVCVEDGAALSLDALQSVCTDAKASPPPSNEEFSSASSVIALALEDQAMANYSYSVHAGERTTIAGTTITSGSVVHTVPPLTIQAPQAVVTLGAAGDVADSHTMPNVNIGERIEVGIVILGCVALAGLVL